jgi:hypothetical protein
MQSMNQKLRPGRFVLLLLTVGTIATLIAQTNDEPKILFLRLRMVKEKSIELIEATERSGELKPQVQASQPEGIHFDLLSAEGKFLWHGAIGDPTQRPVEYQDPQSGQIKRKYFETNEAEFMIRIPAFTNGQRVKFYRLTKVGTNEWGRTNQIGSLVLPGK